MGVMTPSENEWLIMEIIWKQDGSMTAAQIIGELKESVSISQKTIRVMISRLVAKGVLAYTVDEHDTRVYHYYALRSRAECLSDKSERFVKHYFGGNAGLAVASFLRSADITGEQLSELKELVEQLKEKKDGHD